MPKKQNLKNKGNYVGNLLVKFRNKDCKTTELELLFQVLPVRIVTFVKTTGSHLKVIALYCIAHPYCARFVASLARAHSARTSRE